jgi:hypothetical protein
MKLACKWPFSALPVLTLVIRGAPVLENSHFRLSLMNLRTL